MPPDPIPTVEPVEVTAGDTWYWRRSVTNYRNDEGWTLLYYLEGPGKLEVIGEAEADGGGWLVTVPKADTQELPAGAYVLHGFVDDDTERYRVFRAGLSVKVDPASIETPRKSHAQTMLELIEAALEGRIPKDRESVAIDGTQITRIPVERLRTLRATYATEYQRELHPERSPIGSITCRDVF